MPGDRSHGGLMNRVTDEEKTGDVSLPLARYPEATGVC